MSRYVTVPLLAAGAGALKLYADFEKSFTNIRALVGVSGKQIGIFKEQVLSLSRRTAKAPKELADALYFVTSSGFKGASAMRVLRASAEASAAGLGETMVVADAVTSAVNAYGEANLKASKATDILLATVREGKAEPAELAGAIGRVIAPAQTVGVEFDEVGAALAGLSLTGLDASEAVTALRGVLMTVMNPTKQAREALNSIGITADELQLMMQDDFMGTMVRLRNEFGYTREEAQELADKPLGDLKVRLGENRTAIGDLFGNVRALNGFLSLTGRNVEKNEKVFAALSRTTDDTGRAFDKARRDPMFRFDRALTNLKATAIEVAPQLLPLAERLLRLVEGWARALGRMDKGALEQWTKTLGALVVAGPVLRLIGGGLNMGAGALKLFGGLAARGAGGAVAGAAGSAAASGAAAAGGAAAGTAGGAAWGSHLKGGLSFLRPTNVVPRLGAAGMGGAAAAAGAVVLPVAIGEGIVDARRAESEAAITEHGFDSKQGREARGALGIDRRAIDAYTQDIKHLKVQRREGQLTIDQETQLQTLLKARRSIYEEIAQRRRGSVSADIGAIQAELTQLGIMNGKLTENEERRLAVAIANKEYDDALKLVEKATKEATRAYTKGLDPAIEKVQSGWETWTSSVFSREKRLNESYRRLEDFGTASLLALVEAYGDVEAAAGAAAAAQNAENWGWETSGGAADVDGGNKKGKGGRSGGGSPRRGGDGASYAPGGMSRLGVGAPDDAPLYFGGGGSRAGGGRGGTNIRVEKDAVKISVGAGATGDDLNKAIDGAADRLAERLAAGLSDQAENTVDDDDA